MFFYHRLCKSDLTYRNISLLWQYEIQIQKRINSHNKKSSENEIKTIRICTTWKTISNVEGCEQNEFRITEV